MNTRLLQVATVLVLFGAVPALAAEPDLDSPPPAGAEIPRFEIRTFRVEGNTLLPPEEIPAILAPFTGADRDFGHIQQALDALESAYRTQGYGSVAVYLPEQELKEGTVTFRVVEAKLSRIHVANNRHFTTGNILASFPSLVTGTSPRIHEISKNLRAVNENPAKKISLQLQQGEREEEITARLEVIDERYWKAGLTFDDSGNRQTGTYRLGLLLQHFNLHNRDHVATLQYTTSPDHADRVNSVSGSYRLPLYALGDTIDFFAGYSDVDSGTIGMTTNSFSYTASNINGKGIITGVRYNLTLRRFGEYAQKLIAGMDYRFYDNSSDFDVTMPGIGSVSSGSDRSKLVIHPVSLTYSGTCTLERGEAGIYLGGVYNIPWGAYGDREDFPAGTAADYFVLRYGANLVHGLPGDFQARLGFNGQYAPRTLVPYEQLGLGGAGIGRGYEERAAAGDIGYSGTAEIFSPDLARLASFPASQFRLVAFYDDGYLRRAETTGGDDGGARVSSAGGGIRLSIASHFTLSADWGVTLSSLPDLPRGDNRLHFRAALLY